MIQYSSVSHSCTPLKGTNFGIIFWVSAGPIASAGPRSAVRKAAQRCDHDGRKNVGLTRGHNFINVEIAYPTYTLFPR